MFLNLDGANTHHYQSDTYVTYLNECVTVTDPHDYIANATITIQQDSEQLFKYTILTVIEFDGEMGPTNMAARIWNDNSQSTNIRVLDALDIVPVADLPESTTEEEEEETSSSSTTTAATTTTETSVVTNDNTDDILSSIKMWAGFDSQSISDSQLLDALNLDYPDVDIPDWVMTDLGVLAAQGDITVDELQTALVFVLNAISN